MLVLVFITLLLVAGAGAAYRLSPVRAASVRASAAVSALEALRADLLAEEERMTQGVAAAARQLESTVRADRRRALQIEDIKRYTSGLCMRLTGSIPHCTTGFCRRHLAMRTSGRAPRPPKQTNLFFSLLNRLGMPPRTRSPWLRTDILKTQP